MNKTIKFLLLLATIAFFSGCATDVVIVLDHPSEVKPEAVVSVKLGHGCIFLSDTSVMRKDISRDSLHFLIGTPKDWNVERVSFYIANHINFSNDISQVYNSSDIHKAYQDSLAVFETRSQQMRYLSEAPTFSKKNREISAHGTNLADKITVSTNSVGKWFEYCSAVNIKLSKGTKMDTVFAIDTSFASMLPNKPTKEQLNLVRVLGYDTIGVKVIPIFIFVKLKAPSAASLDTLYYFSKTDSIPQNLKGNPMYGGYGDLGDMVFVPVNVTESAFSLNIFKAVNREEPVFYPNPFKSKMTISAPGFSSIDIFSSSGDAVKKLLPDQSSLYAIWDGTDYKNRPLNPGFYLLKISYTNGVRFSKVKLIK